MAALQPGATIGILGGGQLGRMLAMAAAKLGFRTLVLDPQENSPAFQVSTDFLIADYTDNKALDEFVDRCDVVTYEFENVDVFAIRSLQKRVPCYPGPEALKVSQDRLIEKSFINDLNIATAPFTVIDTRSDLEQALSVGNGVGILKTRRFGYDGKGQVRLSPDKPERLEDAFEIIDTAPCILEGLVDFEREISVIAARSIDGDIQLYNPAENVHQDGILKTSTVPADISVESTNIAQAMVEKLITALDYVGVMGIEFFVTLDGELMINEFAPRVHNSGHWTEAACVVSQFEQHIRAVSGMTLGNPVRHSDCYMENLIGSEAKNATEIATRSNTMLHLYGKAEIREGRKMGHFTTLT